MSLEISIDSQPIGNFGIGMLYRFAFPLAARRHRWSLCYSSPTRRFAHDI